MIANNDGPCDWDVLNAMPAPVRSDSAAAIRRCRETPGDVMPEPGARYRSPWSRDVMDRNAERARDGR